MSKLLNQIKNAVKEKALEEAFKSDDGVSTNPDVVFDKRKNVPTKAEMKIPGKDVDAIAADNAKIEKGKDAAKEDNKKDINHKKFKQKDKASVIGEGFDKEDEDNVDDNDDNDNDDAAEPKEVKIDKPDESDDDDNDGDQEVDIKVRRVTKEDVNVEEHLAALLGRENDLSEEFKERAKNILEAAVIDAANSVIEEVVIEIYEQKEAEQEEFVEAMVEKMDSYLDKVVSEWLEENRVEIQSNVRTEIAESFLIGLKDLFEQHYIEIPEEKVDIVEELVSRVEMLEANLDEEINKNVALEDELTEARKEVLVTEHLEGLSDNQKERLKMLAEGIELTSEDKFAEQIEALKESYFATEVKTVSVDHDEEPVVLNEEVVDESKKKLANNPVGESIAAQITNRIRKIR